VKSELIQPTHLKRKAVVYIRQSTPHQVVGMRPTMGDADRGAALAGRARQAVVSLIAVELQDPVKAGEEALGIFTAASGGVKIDHPRWIVTASCCLAYRFAT